LQYEQKALLLSSSHSWLSKEAKAIVERVKIALTSLDPPPKTKPTLDWSSFGVRQHYHGNNSIVDRLAVTQAPHSQHGAVIQSAIPIKTPKLINAMALGEGCLRGFVLDSAYSQPNTPAFSSNNRPPAMQSSEKC
jgi:hypothetical protein